MNKEKMIKEMAETIVKNCNISKDCPFPVKGCPECWTTALVNAGYGNIREFAEYLIAYVKEVQENGYEGIGELDIRDKLEQFLGE